MVIHFKGTIFPCAHGYIFSSNKISSRMAENGGHLEIIYSVEKSVFNAELTLERVVLDSEFGDIDSLSLIVADAIQRNLDIYNFVAGSHSTVIIDQAMTVGFDEAIHPLTVIPCIADSGEDKEQAFRDIQALTVNGGLNVWYIQKILRDLNYATRFPLDTGFFCYRAIETMGKFFCNSMSDDIDKNSWVKMRSHLSVDRADLEFVKSTADAARHGSFIDISSSLREKIFTTTWDVAKSFFKFAERKYDNLESSFERDISRNPTLPTG